MPVDPLFEAASFAARAHKHQLRKDGQTPYAAHPFRVCLVVQHVFGIRDPQVLMAALLHDTIEDTATDFDDILERFGPEVAKWVAALTKDMRMEEAPRELAYHEALTTAGWQVVVCKLADIYDNLNDSHLLPPEKLPKTFRRSAEYLEALRPILTPESRPAFEVVLAKLSALRNEAGL